MTRKDFPDARQADAALHLSYGLSGKPGQIQPVNLGGGLALFRRLLFLLAFCLPACPRCLPLSTLPSHNPAFRNSYGGLGVYVPVRNRPVPGDMKTQSLGCS